MRTMWRNGVWLGLLLCCGLSVQAQITSKKTLTLDGARQVLAAAKAEALRLKAPGAVIAVVDEGGNVVAVERLDGTFATSTVPRRYTNLATVTARPRPVEKATV